MDSCNVSGLIETQMTTDADNSRSKSEFNVFAKYLFLSNIDVSSQA